MYIKIIFLCFIFKLICGDDIAQRLTERYNDVRSECIDRRNHSRPAFECSGLIARGLNGIGSSNQRYAWSTKESNRRKNAFSATFLRSDQPYKSFPLGYKSGFIYYPHMKTPRGKNTYPVYCAFPVDGWTDFREGRHGCGQWRNDKTGRSGHCNAQGITSLSTWIPHFETVSKGRNFEQWQCGFDTTTKDKAKYFAVAIEAKKHLRQYSNKYGWKHTELIIRAWNEFHPEKLPIEAFFYLLGNNSGKQKALTYQRDYLALTGETIPVVGIQLPQPNNPDFIVVSS